MRNAQISLVILIACLLVVLLVTCNTYQGTTPTVVPNGAQAALDACLEQSADQALRSFALQGLIQGQGLNAWAKDRTSKIPSEEEVESGLAVLVAKNLAECQPVLPENLRLAQRGPLAVKATIRNESVAFEADASFVITNGAGSKTYDHLSTILPSRLDEQYTTAVVMANGHLDGRGVDITDSISRKLDVDMKKSASGIEIRIADPQYTESNPVVLAFVLS